MNLNGLPRMWNKQRGATLIVAMIMLAALGLLAVTAFNSGTTNLRIVGNMQERQEALAAAQHAIDQTISSEFFATSSAAVASAPIHIDVEGKTYTVSLADSPPTCYRARTLSQPELDHNSASDRSCMVSSAVSTPMIEVTGTPVPSGGSLCADAEWALRATTSLNNGNATTAINQGVSFRILKTDLATNCP